MIEFSEFPKGVAEKLGNYVYRLIDPRNGETFYIGKGRGNRVFNHVAGVNDPLNDGAFRNWEGSNGESVEEANPKVERIRSIKDAGLQVVYIIHRHRIPDSAIFDVEAALIDAFSGLDNLQGGHGSNAYGPMSVQQIVDLYALPEMQPRENDRLILININLLDNRSDPQNVYKQTRLAWRISKSRAEKADFVLSVVRGVVVGAFIADDWLPATVENFPERYGDGLGQPGRKGFRGQCAPEDVWNHYVGIRGKRVVVDEMKHVQNPIRYWKV
ncbi:hypothetical protein [uncultured Roseovarius sp.]|uniref:LEM-3-like GIY-YIG domain-containing protein n=1 Tax=uncultured Roseovarius sp. TaxID=293344 RepID=UPI0025939B06|nr:hypothetical protein [uncultured Roseovarius sp.]